MDAPRDRRVGLAALFYNGVTSQFSIAEPDESSLPDMTKFWHAGHQIEIWDVGKRAQDRVAWEYIIDGLRSTRTCSTEKEATGAAIELAERLPALI